MTLDFNEICRVCLQSKTQTNNIFTCYYYKRNILYSEMLFKCTEIKPHKGDGLPSIICKECSRQLKRAYAFNVQCVESDKKLLSIVENKTSLSRQSEIKDESENDTKVGCIDNVVVKEEENAKLQPEVTLENVKQDIKIEPNYENDDYWDADDDNVLFEIKSRKYADESSVDNSNEVSLSPKKKRGRKKKVGLGGEVPPVSESKLPHQCDVCGKFLSTKSNLKAHKVCHTNLRPYKCNDCTATFRGYSALFQHRKMHTGETPYHCEYCPKQFSRRTGLVNHVRIHTGEKRYNCDICFKNFAQSAQLSIHMKRHKGEKSYLCQDCGKGFPIRADLKVHQRIHNGEKPYSCHLCTKTFATSGNLSIHIRIHNKEIRYKCGECSRGFVTCSAYRVHEKRHRGQRDHRCECGKAFYTASALRQHRVVHTGERRYLCRQCRRAFSQTSHLARHYRKEHIPPGAPLPAASLYRLVVTPKTEEVS